MIVASNFKHPMSEWSFHSCITQFIVQFQVIKVHWIQVGFVWAHQPSQQEDWKSRTLTRWWTSYTEVGIWCCNSYSFIDCGTL